MKESNLVASFCVAGKPIPQPRPRAFRIGVRASVYAAPRHHPIHAYRQAVALKARESYGNRPPQGGPVEVVMRFVLARSTTGSRAVKRNPSLWWHDGRPDIENLAKGVLDALSGIVFLDDRQVARLTLEKLATSSRRNEATYVSVYTADPIESELENKQWPPNQPSNGPR